ESPDRCRSSFPTRRSSDLAITLAVLAVTAEYASGTIRPTLQAVPVRGRMLAAKALVVAPLLFAATVLTGAAAALATYLVLLAPRSEEHTSELQSRENLVCR